MNTKIIIEDREGLTLSGAVSLESVTAEKLIVYTNDGDLVIKGRGLEGETFDPAAGILKITGRIDGVFFTTEKYHLSDNIIKKLFR